MGLLDGKVVIVTGGGNGIGRAYCKGIAREGGIPVAADIDEAAAASAAREISGDGARALGVRTDVADSSSCRAMARAALEAFGRIDGLVNNAAVFLSVPVTRSGFQDIREEEWDRVMAVNVKGLWLCSRAVAPAMQERRRGSIVNIASNMAYNGGAGMMHYVVSKAAVVGFSRVLARELGPFDIRVNTLAPGSTASESDPTEAALREYERSAAKRMLNRIERPEDVVGTALYLLSDLSAFVTGQSILVNGGANLH